MKARKNRGLPGRRPALSTIAVAATLIAGGAQAAETNVFGTAVPPATVNGYTTVESTQANINTVDAAISSATGEVTVDGNGAPVTGSTLQASDNLIRASAGGNSFTNTIDLAATPETAGTGTGAGSLGLSVNTNGLDEDDLPVTGNVTSSVTGSTVRAVADHFEDGNATVTGNTISAVTQVNSGSTSIAGKVNGGQTSFNTPGSTTLDTVGTPLATAIGGVVATSVQRSDEAGGSSATVSDNAVELQLTHPDTQVIEAGPVLGTNTISATLKGNTARTTIDLQSGDAPAFEGSAVLSNLQERNAAAASALAADSSIGAVVHSSEPGSVVTLQGALSVSGNSIASAATGNEALGANGTAGNRILVGDQLSVTGATGAGTPQNNAAHDSGSLGVNLDADLAILNSQGNNFGANVGSTTEDSRISGAVQSLDGGSVALSGNGISAAATGNAAASAIASGAGAAAFDATAAIANQQTNYNVGVTATVDGSDILAGTGLNGGVTQNGTVTVEGNSASARASGNEASQSISLAANSVGLGGGNAVLTGGTAVDGNVSAAGGATLTNLQANYNGSVSAVNADSTIGLDADSRAGGPLGNVVANSTLSTAGNTQEAVALGNSAGNALSLSGNDVSTGAGIASVQIGGLASPVSATLDSAAAGLVASTHVAGSTLAVEDNLQRAIGYGNSASNTLDVQANNVTGLAVGAGVASQVGYDAADAVAFNGAGDLPTVTAAYGILNNQSIQSGVSAEAVSAPGQGGLGLIVEGNLAGSSARNEGNAFVGAAYGNDASNSLTLEATDLSTTGVGTTPVASATNVQAVAGSAAVLARAAGGNVVLTDIEDDVTNASVSASENTIQALAYGSRATTRLEAGGVDIATSTPASSGATSSGGNLQANAAFTVQNAQSGQGSVVATQLDAAPASATSAAGVRLEIGTAASVGSVPGPLRTELLNSSAAADGNTSSAGATSNSATNGLALDANSLAATSALQNFQVTNADVSAFIGLAGTPATGGSIEHDFSASVTATGLAGNAADGVVTLTGGTLTVQNPGALSDAERNYLESLAGWSYTGGVLTGPAVALGTIPSPLYSSLDTGGTASLPFTIPAVAPTPGTPNQGGVVLAVQSSTDPGYTAQVIGSTLSVNDNTTSGSVTGNSASNTLAVTANEIAHGTAQTTSTASSVGGSVLADHALSNVQSVTEGATLTSNVSGTFAIDVAADATIQDSALSVSGNSQRASAVANTATSSLSLSGTSVSAGSALSSVQGSEAAVAASSSLEVFAPAAVANSSVSLSDNRNTALGVINDASNTLSVAATNVAPVGGVLANAVLLPGIATGDHVLSNLQTAETAVSSSASTQLYNQDRAADQTSGVVNSTVAISGNSTVSEASANRAANAVSVEGAAALNASAGLINQQVSSADVTSTATTTAALNLTGNGAVLNGSSLSIDGNSTSALARGNSASNVLNASAGGSYGASSSTTAGSALALGGLGSTNATAAILNAQGNTGDVTASSTNVAYQVALNAGAPAGAAVAGSTVGVTGNSVAASAYGNSATNALTLTALNTGAPGAGAPTAAVGNYQVNSGAIVATATSVAYGIGVTGGVGGSSLRATGNQVTANAVGNSAASSILSAR
ncbi:beta strand repeat-containing protein [Xenophilus azovorans]|uniref:beta strand repeat-containing protein n=1 Tax=Xenophilus azovorans TaxID=151755 RepID=UPI0005703AE8|nr:hypothetical protein [Xenophilus azovorans]